ncbi:MAG TPA: ribonuclease P [Methanosarcinales archaeon]|nr:ribonuclease P [Methanosarcinales archaeon]
MKILPPSLRERKRYIAFELISEKEINKGDLINEMFSSASSLLGDLGSSECNLWMLFFDGRYGMVKCAHTKTEETRAILATIYNIHGVKVSIRVLGISGTVKAVIRKYLK